MPSYPEIYARHADLYDELVRHEDAEGNLGAWLARALPAGRVVELGAGTGRVTRLLAGPGREVRAYDGSSHMIDTARARLADVAGITLGVADNASLPEPTASADAVVAGWTIGHVTGFFPDAWESHARAALGEMARVGRQGALHVVVETLGTCVDEPGPPNPRLAALYALYESMGLARVVLRTDYRFPSAADAERVMGFFFGPAMAEKVRSRGSATVPEWTGLWQGSGMSGP